MRGHAVVIGGSIGGLLAARVLAEHFERVTIIDRDQFPGGPENRRGVPQGRHTHGMLASGRQVLERLFPGICRELFHAGAVSGDLVGDSKWFFEGGLCTRFVSGMDGLLASRPMVEFVVRRRVLAEPRIAVMEGAVVTGLETVEGRVAGVRLESGVVGADLVVDASGRGSKAAAWLEAMGYGRPAVERIEVGLGYTTRIFRRREGDNGGDVSVVIPANRGCTRGGVMLAQEGDRWTVTLFSYFRDYAPTELEGFREFARQLPYAGIWEVIRDAEPLGEAVTARFPASVRLRYERMVRFPEGLLVFGDSICSFNPTFGQGMSTAALEAVELEGCLREGMAGLAGRFFARAAAVVDIPWNVSVGADLALPCTVGERSVMTRVLNWYVSRLHRAAHVDRVATLAFHRVANLLAPPESILRPSVVWHVLWAAMLEGK